MFKKPFSIKSNTNVKNCDRKKIFSRLPESVASFIGSKKQLSVVRVQSSLGVWVKIYVCDKNPVFFEPESVKNSILYPSVYFTWMSPSTFPVLFINKTVFSILENGADLMLPGVLVSDEMPLPNFSANAPLAIAIVSSLTKEAEFHGPIAVGKALMSSDDMLASGMRGRAVQLLHFYHDTLWEFGTKNSLPSFLFDSLVNKNLSIEAEVETEKVSVTQPDIETAQIEQPSLEQVEKEHQESSYMAEQIEQLLHLTFFGALRFKLSKETCQLPMDAGQFYASYVIKNVPTGHQIEIKKTKYKKFANFLRQINDNEHGWVIKVGNKKGIDLIEEINFDHPDIKLAEPLPTTSANGCSIPSKTNVSECFSVTEAVLPFFRLFDMKKGDVLQQNRIRDLLLEYASSRSLEKSGKITLDDNLQGAVKYFLPDSFPINDLVQKIVALMTKAFLITMEDGRQKVHRGKLPFIELKVEKRCGNKVVTLINNLSVYGIDPKALSHKIQIGVATGTSLVETSANCEGTQLLVHGNQINFIGEHLTRAHGIEKKYIKGLELGVKEKKKKK